MNAMWFSIIIMAVGCYGFKFAGLSIPARILDHPVTIRTADLIPVALLGALIAVQVLSEGQQITLDGRLIGLATAAGLLVMRAPFLVVVVGAALVAALVRML